MKYCREILLKFGTLIRIRDLIDVPDFSCFDQILIRILYEMFSGTPSRNVFSKISIRVSYKII